MIDVEKISETILASKILVADDDPMVRALIAGFLIKAGYINIEFTENGIETLDTIARNQPDCVILDIEMPKLNGNQVLSKIRNNPETKDLSVVVVTGHDAHEERNLILRSGASDIISKPIDGLILVERVTNILERKQLLNQLTAFHLRLSKELSYATEMQTDMMPTDQETRLVEEKYGVSLSSHFFPSSELGGDAWFLQPLDENRFGIMLIDFSGHGVSAAVNTFRMQTIINRMDPCRESPARYLETINAEIQKILPVEQYCTALYAVIDVEHDKLIYSAASAPAPIYGKLDRDLVLGEGRGLPLGITSNAKYADREIDFPKGSCLFLFSDALYETDLRDRGALGIEGIYELANKFKNGDSKIAHNAILENFNEGAPVPLPDDLTSVWLSR